MTETRNGLNGSTGLIVATAFVVAVIGSGIWMNWPSDDVSNAAADVKPTPAPLATETAETAALSEPVEPGQHTEALADVTTNHPVTKSAGFDEVRQEADGLTVIAGQAEPGASIKVLQDGAEIATATADKAGKFAAIAFVEADGQGHVLRLEQTINGEALLSQDEILLAPLPTPVDVARAPGAVLEPPATLRNLAAVDQSTPTPKQAAQANAPAIETAALEPEVATTSASVDSTTKPTTEQNLAANVLPSPNLSQPEIGEAPAQPAVATALSEPTVSTAPEQPPASNEAPQKVAILKASSTGVELVKPVAPTPEEMANIVLDTISYSDEGDVQLAGRAQSQAVEVRVYLNNTSIVELPVDAAGKWRGDLPNVDEGIYTLRIDEVAPDGSVSSRVETPFKRESPEVLAAASLGGGPIKAITVQKGATLWAIARDRYGDGLLYLRVFEANAQSIRNPDLIYPGQVFDLPQ